MGKFAEILNSVDSSLKFLPVFHATDVFTLREILMAGKLKPVECDVFKPNKLIYSFYGKSSYRLKHGDATGNSSKFPTVFILRCQNLPKPFNIYPFDTGAYHNESLKEKYFHKLMDVTHFSIGNEIENAKKFVTKIYNSNQNYYESKPVISESDIPAANLEALSYLTFVKDNSDSKFDDRIKSVEVIFDHEIELNYLTLENIIGPKSFLGDPDISKVLIDKFNISKPIGYHTHKGSPIEYQALISHFVREHLESNSLL